MVQLIRSAEVAKILGVSRSTLWRLVRDGGFPAPLRLSPRRTAYLRETVDTWIAARASASGSLPAVLERTPAVRAVRLRRSRGKARPLSRRPVRRG